MGCDRKTRLAYGLQVLLHTTMGSRHCHPTSLDHKPGGQATESRLRDGEACAMEGVGVQRPRARDPAPRSTARHGPEKNHPRHRPQAIPGWRCGAVEGWALWR
uniref:Uncharacterized protein n=1 Tax=Eutreptiella gymnastica TaxID=73025 RepID=A0A7S4LLG9_9EUGL